jgi:hypothetical protein
LIFLKPFTPFVIGRASIEHPKRRNSGLFALPAPSLNGQNGRENG